MQVFTYKDYIRAIHTFRMSSIESLAECCEEYSLEDAKEKLVKNIFKDKKMMICFLNSFIQLNKKITEEQLVLYDEANIKLSDTEILYKMKDEEVFFLICYYFKLNNNFPYKLLNLCVDILKQWRKKMKTNNIKKYPKVVPIIVYKGGEKWYFPKKINSKYLEETTYGENSIILSYNLVDLSRISIKEPFSTNFIKYNEVKKKEDNNGRNTKGKKY